MSSQWTRRGVLGGVLPVVGVAAVASVPLRAAAPRLDPDVADEAIDAAIADIMQASAYPGLAVAIEKGGQVILAKGYGIADLERKTPVTPETRFPIGSVTKSFTGLAVMQLMEAGQIDIGNNVGYYLPSVPAPIREVPVRHLLNHTSGIVNYTSLPDFPSDLQRAFTTEEIVTTFAAHPLEFRPGERFSYSNSNTYLLGLIVEAASGRSYADYLASNIFEPFGMRSTTVSGFRQLVEGRARGYTFDGGWKNARQFDVNYPFSAGAVVSTIGDMLKYRRGVFGDGPTSEKVRKWLLTLDKLSDGTPIFYGLGCLAVGTFEGHRRISHSGDIEGFAAHYAYYPDSDLTIVVLANLEHGAIAPYAIVRRLSRIMFGVPRPAILDLPISMDQLAAIEGDYQVGRIQFGPGRYGFFANEGKLFMRFGGTDAAGPAIPLLYQGAGRYVTAIDTEFTFTFRRKRGQATQMTAEFYDGIFEAFRMG